MGPYSTDLRERIVATTKHDRNTPPEVATQSRIGTTTAYHYPQLAHDLDDLTPLTSPGRPRKITDELEARLVEQVQANNNLTLAEHGQRFEQATSLKVSLTWMHQSLARANLTHKKHPSARRSATRPTASSGA